jgi:ribosomal protein L11 methyltransferase
MPPKANRWVEISVQASREAVDDLVRYFERYCTGGAVIEDRPPDISQQPNGWVVVKGFLPTWDDETRRKLEIALMLLSRSAPVSEPVVTVLEPEDWAETWKAYFLPQHLGERVVVVPSWHSYDPQPGEVIIHLDPGMAFGTGLHATTRLCLLGIDRHLAPGMRVLDVGTGSGILAISAALQGAAEVLALDVDPVAAEVARENVGLNGVNGRVTVAHGTVGGHTAPEMPLYAGGGYDLVLANILAEIIIDMAPNLADTLKPGGLLVASGIISPKADAVAEALAAAGVPVTERLQEDDWVALLGRKV